MDKNVKEIKLEKHVLYENAEARAKLLYHEKEQFVEIVMIVKDLEGFWYFFNDAFCTMEQYKSFLDDSRNFADFLNQDENQNHGFSCAYFETVGDVNKDIKENKFDIVLHTFGEF